MRVGVVYSLSDIAAVGIVNHLVQNLEYVDKAGSSNKIFASIGVYLYKGIEIVVAGTEKEVVFLTINDLTNDVHLSNVDFIIVPSKHQSQARVKSLTVHPTGNPWRRNDYGGEPMSLSMSNPVLMWLMLHSLSRLKQRYSELEQFSVSYEVTHHGPSIPLKPITFIEIGSTEDEWRNPIAQSVVAEVIIDSLSRLIIEGGNYCTISVGFGGNHYAALFTKRALEVGECYGHMIPNYAIKELGLDDLRKVAEMAIRLTPNAKKVVIEKMRSEFRETIAYVAKGLGLEVEVH
jgi:D-aminoacyl-tRNA deacylase